jgi:hypothetical protein
MLRHDENSKARSHTPWWRDAEVREAQLSVPTIAESEQRETLQTEVRDVGEELEEEARQRALLTNNETVIPLNYPAYFRKVSRIFIPIFASYIAILMVGTIFFAMQFHEFPFMFIGLLALLCGEAIGIHFWFRYLEKKNSDSALVLSRTGIQLAYPMFPFAPIRWDEIAEIRPYRFLMWHYIGIIPKDTAALAKRLGGKAGSQLRANDRFCIPYKWVGIYVAPLNILASTLPMSAEAFMAQVAALRTGSSD